MPGLKQLELVGMYPKRDSPLRTPIDKTRDPFASRPPRAIAKRKKHGHPLRKLGLNYCHNVRASDLKALEDALGEDGELQWDGQGELPPGVVEDERGGFMCVELLE